MPSHHLNRLSIVLSVLLILCLLPAAASAADTDTKTTEVTLTVCEISVEAVPAGVFGDIYIDGVLRDTALVPKGSTVTVSVTVVPAGQAITVELSGAESYEVGADGKTVIVKNINALDAHVKLIANNSVSVTFNANGGAGAMNPQTFTAGVPAKLRANEFTAPYTWQNFAGWAVFPFLGIVKYHDEETITITEDTTLYAVWSGTKPSGGGSGGASIWVQPTTPPQPQIIVDEMTSRYTGVTFIGTTAANLSAIEQTDKVYAAEIESRLAAAKEAGLPLVNSRGAPAIVVLKGEKPEVETEHFTRVYDIEPAAAGEKLTEVEIPVPMADIASSGLTYEDVNIYHCIEEIELWVPLEIVKITFDAENYYFTAKTEGASPFGVLIKHFEPAGPGVGEIPTPVPKTAAPLAGLLAGLGAAGVLLGLKRK